jgi:type IV pilus assembly protein PilB
MILVTGPTGSGKTVSLYTCLNILNQPGVNISTVEDPAEINLPGINQVNVNDKAGLTFSGRAEGLPAPGSGHHHGRRNPRPGNRRHRHQGRPDRPPGAVDAAHQRRADHADAPAEHGRGAVQHRLERDPDHGAAPGARLCEACKTPAEYPRDAAEAPGYKDEDLDGSWKPYKAVGLLGLQQRLQGPRGHLPGDADHRGIQRIILANGTAMDIAQQAQREGVRDLRQSGLHKVRAGVTTLEEVISVTNE